MRRSMRGPYPVAEILPRRWRAGGGALPLLAYRARTVLGPDDDAANGALPS
jgi:hypothetical protein